MHTLPDWARVWGPPLIAARIRASAADFVVTEELAIDFSDDGEHDWLNVEKINANTQWVAERLADHAGVAARDVGFAGLKDRHAVTRQWFSVRRATSTGTDWQSFAVAGVRVLAQKQHRRKLRRGAHERNRFRIALRADHIESERDALDRRLATIGARGVPNYFGEQRFGRGGANLELCRAVFTGRRVSRAKRSLALSAARSLIFNDILAARVADGTWNTLLPGECVNLDGSASVFSMDAVTSELAGRCAEMDVHPSGTLWGLSAPRSTGSVAALEQQVAATHAALVAGLAKARVEASSRPLRLRVQDFNWEFADGALWLEFALGPGSYATAVLRELATTSDASSVAI